MKLWLSFFLLILLLSGCVSQQPVYRPAPATSKPEPEPEPEPEPVITQAKPKKIYQIKEVQDDNFSPEYMYPEVPKSQPKTQKEESNSTVSVSMQKEDCIAMIGQQKFDKYTQMLGSESATIKRCILLKSMK